MRLCASLRPQHALIGTVKATIPKSRLRVAGDEHGTDLVGMVEDEADPDSLLREPGGRLVLATRSAWLSHPALPLTLVDRQRKMHGCDFTDRGDCAAKADAACICADPGYQAAKRIAAEDDAKRFPNCRDRDFCMYFKSCTRLGCPHHWTSD